MLPLACREPRPCATIMAPSLIRPTGLSVALIGTLLLAASCSALTVSPLRGPSDAELPWNTSIAVDLSEKLPMSDILYGIFFEEVGAWVLPV